VGGSLVLGPVFLWETDRRNRKSQTRHGATMKNHSANNRVWGVFYFFWTSERALENLGGGEEGQAFRSFVF